MRETVNAYAAARKNLLAAFGCPGRYFIQPVTDSTWRVNGAGDMHILSYEQDGATTNAVVVRQDGYPLIYRSGGYALVIAIDCVRIAFLLDERREMRP